MVMEKTIYFTHCEGCAEGTQTDYEFVLEFNVSQYHAATFYDPAEGGEVEFERVMQLKPEKKEVDWDTFIRLYSEAEDIPADSIESRLEEACYEQAREAYEDDYDDSGDW